EVLHAALAEAQRGEGVLPDLRDGAERHGGEEAVARPDVAGVVLQVIRVEGQAEARAGVETREHERRARRAHGEALVAAAAGAEAREIAARGDGDPGQAEGQSDQSERKRGPPGGHAPDSTPRAELGPKRLPAPRHVPAARDRK